MMKIIGLILAMLVAGCSVPAKIVSIVAKPVMNLAVEDAHTTLAWVDRQEEAGAISAEEAAEARMCPGSVVALDLLRTVLAGRTGEENRFRGVIYYGTVNRYGRGPQAMVSERLRQLAQDCVPLVPVDKLIKMF